jgi:predicted RND superfamily exporter protein
MLGLGWGIPRLETSVHLSSLFSSRSRIVADYTWIEQHVGALVPLEVVVDFHNSCPFSPADRFLFVERVQRELRAIDHVKGTTSCANMMPELPPDDGGANGRELRQLLNAVLPAAGPQLAAYRYLHESADRQQWRVTAFVSALEPIDYAQMLSTIRERLAAAGVGDRSAAGIAVHLTGVMPLVHEIQRALMHDLFVSFLSAFAIIFAVMTIVQAGFWTAAISMIPNFFPTVFMFGLLGWLEIPLDIGSVMTASIALGIAIDDVLHFLTFYRRALARGLSRQEAVHATYQQCGFAMFVSSLVCGLGPLVFCLSDFLPASRFAWMMLLLLMVAVLGDLILLPALVVGPLGKWFENQYPQPRILNVPRVDASTVAEPDQAAA